MPGMRFCQPLPSGCDGLHLVLHSLNTVVFSVRHNGQNSISLPCTCDSHGQDVVVWRMLHTSCRWSGLA